MNVSSSLQKMLGGKVKHIEEVWQINTNDSFVASPAIFEEGIVIGTKKGQVIEVSNTGSINWSYQTEETVSESEKLFLDEENVYGINDKPLIIQDNNKRSVVVVSEFGTVHGISSEGKLLWKIKTGGPVRASPIIAENNEQKQVLVFGSHDTLIYIATLQGEIIETIEIGEAIETKPVVYKDSIIIGTTKGKVIAIDWQGKILWTFQTSDKISAPMTLTELKHGEGIHLLVGSEDMNLYALTLNGEPLWSFQTEGSILAQPIAYDVNNDGHKEILLASCDNTIYCLSAFGEELWSYETDFWITTAPVVADIDGDGIVEVVIGSFDSKIYVFDAQGNYIIDYLPGLGGIVHQTGHYTATMYKDVGKNKGKLFCKYKTDNDIVGCVFQKGSKNIFAGTKKGKIYNMRVDY